MTWLKAPLPLALYVHIPWCVRKCPYCDFNSHAVRGSLPEESYVAALINELEQHLPLLENRTLTSIFFGGGTPSLFSAQAIEKILTRVAEHFTLPANTEITLEANPGTIDQAQFAGFHAAGINRLSLGVQSLQDDKLQILGRIHNAASAKAAILQAKKAGFTNFNIDLMYGLPQQSQQDALHDLNGAIDFSPTHLSWYQLTIEPNTVFYKQPPPLPADDMIWEMQLAGQALLQQAGFLQYEVSAYAKPTFQCQHNRNYWEFGDYLGIGAGAHSKITSCKTGDIIRFAQTRHPTDYLDANKRSIQNKNKITANDLIFEFMLNALRLTDGISTQLFQERTGIPPTQIASKLTTAQQRELLTTHTQQICTTSLGKRFLNDLTSMFLN